MQNKSTKWLTLLCGLLFIGINISNNISSTSAYVADSFEENNSSINSKMLNLDTVYPLTSDSVLDSVDWFYASMTAGIIMRVNVSTINSALQCQISLYNSSMSYLKSINLYGSGSVLLETLIDVSGSYFIKLQFTQGTDIEYQLEITTRANTYIGDSYDPNENSGAAKEIFAGNTYPLRLDEISDIYDWFNLSIGSTGQILNISLKLSAVKPDMYIYLYNSTMNIIKSKYIDDGSNESLTTYIQQMGWYYIRISCESGVNFEYQLSIELYTSSYSADDFEDNQDESAAKIISPGSHTELSLCTGIDENDWFMFFVDANKKVIITSTSNTPQLRLEIIVYNASLEPQAEGWLELPGTLKTPFYTLSPGNFYLRIWTYTSVDVIYDITIEIAPISTPSENWVGMNDGDEFIWDVEYMCIESDANPEFIDSNDGTLTASIKDVSTTSTYTTIESQFEWSFSNYFTEIIHPKDSTFKIDNLGHPNMGYLFFLQFPIFVGVNFDWNQYLQYNYWTLLYREMPVNIYDEGRGIMMSKSEGEGFFIFKIEFNENGILNYFQYDVFDPVGGFDMVITLTLRETNDDNADDEDEQKSPEDIFIIDGFALFNIICFSTLSLLGYYSFKKRQF